MNKLFLLIGLVVLVSGPVFGDIFSDLRKNTGYFDGDPNQNVILESGEDYIVIRNTTAKVKIPFYYKGDFWFNEAADVFRKEGQKHCEKNKENTIIANDDPVTFDDHTVLYGCYDTFHRAFDRKFKNISKKVEMAREDYAVCKYYNVSIKEERKYYKQRNCEKSIKIIEEFWPQANKVRKQIQAQQEKYRSNNSNLVYEIKKRVLANKGKKGIEGDDSTIVAASSGTGFFVSSNGHMVTNYHVIEECNSVKVHYKGSEKEAKVLFTDKTNDLAIIKANVKPERAYPVSDEDVSLLEDIIVAGYPLGKKISASIKTSKGSVTALAGYGDNYSNFQIDAPLNSGNSGGPIMNQKGNIVGVAVATYGKDIGVESFNFGVKSSMLKIFANANKLEFMPASKVELTNKDLGKLITEATIYLECWMSVAKIKQFIAEEESRKAFFSDYK